MAAVLLRGLWEPGPPRIPHVFLRAWPDSPEEAATSHFWVPGTAGAQRGPTVWLCPWRPRLSTEKGHECVCVCWGHVVREDFLEEGTSPVGFGKTQVGGNIGCASRAGCRGTCMGFTLPVSCGRCSGEWVSQGCEACPTGSHCLSPGERGQAEGRWAGAAWPEVGLGLGGVPQTHTCPSAPRHSKPSDWIPGHPRRWGWEGTSRSLQAFHH